MLGTHFVLSVDRDGAVESGSFPLGIGSGNGARLRSGRHPVTRHPVTSASLPRDGRLTSFLFIVFPAIAGDGILLGGGKLLAKVVSKLRAGRSY